MSSIVSDVRLSQSASAHKWRISPSGIVTDLGSLGLIALLGLSITALVFTLGFGAEVTQALAMSG
jgi:hypothetical protein